MKHIQTIFITLLFCLIGLTSIASAGDFTIMTEEYPPFNYTEDGKLTGLSSEVMIELLKRVNHPNNITVEPWSRAYNMIQKKKDIILFSMTRTEAREGMFEWVGPVAENKWVFFTKKGSGIKINSLNDAKNLKKIGTYKDDAAEAFLKTQGFTNLDSVVNDDANPKKLAAGRIDAWIVGELQGFHKAKKVLGDSSILEKALDVKSTVLYIAFSKGTAPAEIAKWQKVLDEMKADGTYDKILKKYM